MKTKLTFLCLLFAAMFSATAQDGAQGPAYVGTADSMVHVPSLASRMSELTPSITKEEEMQDGRSVRSPKRIVVPEKGNQKDFLSANPHYLEGQIPSRMPDLVFNAAFSESSPTDPSLAIGPNHVFVVFNTGFAIYDKDGNELVGQTAPNPAIFPSGGCCDLTVSYDNAADRWVLSFLGGGAQVAVSDGPDPVNAGWNVYNINTISDYQKLSVWSDAYYMTDQSNGNRLYAMERAAMLAGESAANVSIQGFTLPGFANFGFASAQALNITDDNTPAPGNAPVVFFQDDAYSGVTTDHIKFWTANPDFDTPGNSTISAPEIIDVTPFTSVFDGASFSNLQEPGGAIPIDVLQGIVMNQAQFRKFATHNSAVFNFPIDIGGGSNPAKQAAIRWYEFRQTAEGQPWTLEQEGTFSLPDGRHAWHGSMAMDSFGNIGLGFTAMGNSATGNGADEQVSSYYTGHLVSDPAGVMGLAPQLIAAGTSPISQGNERYGDYGKLDIDPSDDQTMWFINEYRIAAGRADVVGRFKIAPDFDNDVGVIAVTAPVDGALTATETVTITVQNFGLLDASGFDVTYQIDGGATITEAFPGTLVAGTNATYSFTATGDFSTEGQTYSITASTVYGADEENANDAITVDVTHLNPNDTGVTAITSPVSGFGLTATEDVTIEITNFGSATQTSIPVYYNIDGGADVMETYTGSIAQGATDTYTFTQQADLSTAGTYVFVAGTALVGDVDATNDESTVTVEAVAVCEPVSGCEDFNDGVVYIQLADQTLNPGCDGDGYEDATDTVFNFVLEDNPFDGIVRTGFQNSEVTIWIDFDNDDTFGSDEIIFDGITGGTAEQDLAFTVDFETIGASQNGMHRMRVRGGDVVNGTGDVEDPCSELQYGRTTDYTANITGVLGADDNSFASTELLVNYLPGNQFEVVLNTTDYTNKLPITVFNTLGQKLAYYTVESNGAGYTKTIDMSYVASGVYLIQVGHDNLNKVKKIIVK